MASTSLKEVPIFDGTNWSAWEIEFKAKMTIAGLRKHLFTVVVAPSPADPQNVTYAEEALIEKYEEKQEMAAAYLILALAPSLKHIIKGKNSPNEMWTTLEGQYKKPGSLTAFLLFQKLFQTQFTESSPLNKQIEDVMELRHQATNAGIIISDTHFIFIILLALPQSYSSLSTGLLQRTADTTTLKVEEIHSLIIEEETLKVASAAGLASFNNKGKGKAHPMSVGRRRRIWLRKRQRNLAPHNHRLLYPPPQM
jgi:hypothetical protein